MRASTSFSLYSCEIKDPLAVPHAANTPVPIVAIPKPRKAAIQPRCLATTKCFFELSSLTKSLRSTVFAVGRKFS